MKKDAFMKELEYLLQDIPEEEKEDAIAYYRDYLEEAGADKEEAAIQEFGSPERIAAIIRADLNGNLEEGGEFTESGYGDERFKEPNFQLARRLDLPEEKEPEGGGKDGAGHGSGESAGSRKPEEKRRLWEWWKVAGAVVLACLAVPVVLPLVLGVGGGALGLAFGILGLLVGILVSATIALGAATLALLLAGILMVIFGFARLALPVQGILYIGTGVGIFGLGLLCLALCGLYYGKFLPWLVTSSVRLVSGLFSRKGVHA